MNTFWVALVDFFIFEYSHNRVILHFIKWCLNSGFIIKPDGMFFIGYTLQSMLACFFYSLCLYKTHITFTRTLISRVLVNFVCNVFVGSLCYAFILGFDFQALLTYIVTISFPKNLLYLIPQSLVLYFVIKSVSIPLSKMGLIDSEIAENISFF